ncbi:MAG: 50S ribosomal protein L1 [Deltaproteobacteria bacterium]|nr:MAG: 50S ribosomal protein L1 [Deltaproteobacteria bacterium]
MPNTGKRFQAIRQKVDSDRRYSLDEALEIMKETATAKFDESVDIAVRLGVNPRQADQMVRGAVALPHGTGKVIRVAVFAEGDAARAAEEAGADYVGGMQLIQKIQTEGWTEFDKAIAVRAMMAKVGRIGRILGPRGLMPNPKTGTVVAPEAVAEAVREVKGGRIDFRVEKAGIVHTSVGKASMTNDQLRDNVLALIGTLVRLKPSTAKGVYMRSVALSTTMGPGIRLDTNDVIRASSERR